MQKSNAGFYSACAVVIVLASLFYTWKYIVPNYQKTQGEVAQIDKEISAAKIKLDSLQSTKNSLDELGDLVNKLFIAIPEDKDSPNLITELEALAVKAQLQPLPSIQIADGSIASTSVAQTDSTTSNSGTNPVSVSFTAVGTFPQLNQFITSLEKDVRFTNVKSISFASTPEGEITASVQMEVYKRVASVVDAAAVTQ